MIKTSDIRIRDPFIFPDPNQGIYYLFGTTDENAWDGPATGFDVYQSPDLEQWEGPFHAFRPRLDFWADRHFWAPEVYRYQGNYYMFASFKAEGRCRGTQILVAGRPSGPFQPLSDAPVTPHHWECLDGTLYVDKEGNPWIVFCHEWLQVHDGEICAMPLSPDLRSPVGEPVVLFRASEAKWTRPANDIDYVTDGPFLYAGQQGELLMLWSSGGAKGYTIGVSRSTTGHLLGPWIHEEEPLFDEDGGHGMLFRTFQGDLMLTIHAPNQTPNERPVFYAVEEKNGQLRLKK